jgi:hypothetical protein
LALRYVDDTFVVWPHGPERLQNFLSSINSFRPSIQFTMEIVSDSAIPFLAVLIVGKHDDTGHQSLQKTHSQWPIPQLTIRRI